MGEPSNLQRDLGEWDPADRFGPPSASAIARARMAMLDAMERPADGPLWLAWAAAALMLVMAAVAWQAGGPRWNTGTPSGQAPVRMQFQASNGTRIFWTVHPAGAEPRPGNAYGESHDEI